MPRVIVPTGDLLMRFVADEYDATKSNGDSFTSINDVSGNNFHLDVVTGVTFDKQNDLGQSAFNFDFVNASLNPRATTSVSPFTTDITDILFFLVIKDNTGPTVGYGTIFSSSIVFQTAYNGGYRFGYQDAGVIAYFGDNYGADVGIYGQPLYNLMQCRGSANGNASKGLVGEWNGIAGTPDNNDDLPSLYAAGNQFIVGGNSYASSYGHFKVKDVLVYAKKGGEFSSTEINNIKAALNAGYALPTGTTPVLYPSNNPYVIRNTTQYIQPRGYGYKVSDTGYGTIPFIYGSANLGVFIRTGNNFTLTAPNTDGNGKVKVYKVLFDNFINNPGFSGGTACDRLYWYPPSGYISTTTQKLTAAGDKCEIGIWSDIGTVGNFLTGMLAAGTSKKCGITIVNSTTIAIGESPNNYSFNAGYVTRTYNPDNLYTFELQSDNKLKVYESGSLIYTSTEAYLNCSFDCTASAFSTPASGASMRVPIYSGAGVTNWVYHESTYQVVETLPDPNPPTDCEIGAVTIQNANTLRVPLTTPSTDAESGMKRYYFQIYKVSPTNDFISLDLDGYLLLGQSYYDIDIALLTRNQKHIVRFFGQDNGNNLSVNPSSVRTFTTWNPVPQIVNVSPLASAERNGAAYNVTLVKTNGDGAVTFSCDSEMPNGLSIHPTTGVISGTASVLGVFNSVFRVTDSKGQATTKTLQISVLDVTPPAAPALGMVTTTVDGYNIIPFTIGADEAGGSGTASLRIFRSIDGGATFPFVVGYSGASPFTDGTTGGFPAAALKGIYKAQTVDNANNVSGESNVVTNNTNPNAPVITSSNGEIGGNRILFTFSDNTGGGGVFKNYAQRSTTPDFTTNVVGFDIGTTGNFLDDSAPVGAVVYYRLFSRNRAGNNSAFTATISLTRPVAPVAAFSIPATILINTTFYPVNSSQNATGYAWYVMQGNGSYSLFSSLAEPPITLSGAGTYTFKLAATNAAGSVETTHNITVTLPTAPVITTNSPLSYGRTGYSYQFQLQKTGQTGTFSIIAQGNLPNGAMSASGLISIPNVGSDNYNFTVRYTDVYGQYDDAVLTIPVSDMAVWAFCYRRPLKIEYLESVRIFEPIEGAEEVIEDVPTKREFTLEVGAFGLDEQADLLAFLQEHRRRKKFLFSPELSGEQIVVRIVSAPSESRALAGSDFEVVLREV